VREFVAVHLLHVFAFPLIAIAFIFVHYYKQCGRSLLPPGMEQIGEYSAQGFAG
jgi:hypothetical protein